MRERIVKANKCLHVKRTLRQVGYNQEELDYLFQLIVMPIFFVYRCTEPPLLILTTYSIFSIGAINAGIYRGN